MTHPSPNPNKLHPVSHTYIHTYPITVLWMVAVNIVVDDESLPSSRTHWWLGP